MKSFLFVFACFVCYVFSAIGADASMENFREDPLYSTLAKIYSDDKVLKAVYRSFSAEQINEMEGVNLSFLENYKIGDKLPEDVIQYLDRVIAGKYAQSEEYKVMGGKQFFWLALVKNLRFLETGDIKYLLLEHTGNIPWEMGLRDYQPSSFKERSPLYEKYLQIKLGKCAEKLVLESCRKNDAALRHNSGYNRFCVYDVANTIDCYLRLLINYQNAVKGNYFTPQYIWAIWLFAHNNLIMPEKKFDWRAMSAKFPDKRGDNKFNDEYPIDFYDFFYPYTSVIKNSPFDEHLKSIIKDPEQWKAFRQCAEAVEKERARMEKVINERNKQNKNGK